MRALRILGRNCRPKLGYKRDINQLFFNNDSMSGDTLVGLEI